MKCKNLKNTRLSVLHISALSLLVGVLGGGVSALFSWALTLVTNARESAPWLMLLLPVGGVLTVVLYRVFKMSEYGGTNHLVKTLAEERPIRPWAAPLIFVSTALTHLFGGSAGREGAALQLGGAGASAVANWFRLEGDRRTALVMSGMSAVFAGLFGTPATAAVFVLEFRMRRKVSLLALLPCCVAAVTSQKVAALLGVADESFHLAELAPITLPAAAKILVLTLAVCLLGVVMTYVFHQSHHLSEKWIKNPILRTVLGAVAVIALTALVGDMRYNGVGMHMALEAVEGHADWFDFALKMLFTAVTLAAGLKGGEIVPTFCIGATFGCVLGGALGLDAGLAAALGLVVLFACATNSFLSAMLLGVELFGWAFLPYAAPVCLVAWLLSAPEGLFTHRVFTSPLLAGKSK